MRYETRMPKAISKVMRAVFNNQELDSCSLKGGVTGKEEARQGLPARERDAIIEIISRQFGVDAPPLPSRAK